MGNVPTEMLAAGAGAGLSLVLLVLLLITRSRSGRLRKAAEVAAKEYQKLESDLMAASEAEGSGTEVCHSS
jgi:hypothetical protein